MLYLLNRLVPICKHGVGLVNYALEFKMKDVGLKFERENQLYGECS